MEPVPPTASAIRTERRRVLLPPAPTVPALVASRVTPRVRGAWIVGASAVGILFATAILGPSNQQLLWRNTTVTVAASLAALSAVACRATADSPTRQLRTAMATALVAIAAAQMASDVQAVVGWESAPRPSDAIGFASAIPMILALTIAAKRRVSAAETLMVVLDGLTVFVALWVVLLVVAVGPDVTSVGRRAPDSSIVLVAGLTVASILIGGAFAALARRPRPEGRGLAVFVLGLGFIALGWVAIIQGLGPASIAPRSADAVLIVGILLAGVGASTASLDVPAAVHRRAAGRMLLVGSAPTIVPIVCVALIALLLLVRALPPNGDLVQLGAAGIILIATARMSLLAWERTRLTAQAQVARDEAALLEEATAGLLERLDPIGLMETLVTRAAIMLESDEAFLYLLDPSTAELRLEIGTTGLAPYLGRRTPSGVGLAGRVLATGQPLVVDGPVHGPAVTSDLPSYAVAAAVPLGSGPDVSGVLGLLRTTSDVAFGAHDLRVLRRLGQLGSIALDHARMYSDANKELSERRQTEAALRDAEQKFRSLVERLPGAVYLYPVDASQPAYLSPQITDITGYRSDELLVPGTTAALVHPEDREHVSRIRAAAAVGPGSANVLDYRIVTRDGRTRAVHEESVLLPGSDGQPAYRQGLITDVTDRLELQERLRQAIKMEAVGRLAGGVAHDFNNLLTAIGGFAELLALELPTDGDAASTVEQIRQASDRAATLTRQLLAFSRRQVLRPQVIDLNAVVVEIEPMLRRLIGEHISIDVSVAHDLPPVRVDRGQIDQVILNLALNARDAMPDGGRVSLSTAVRLAGTSLGDSGASGEVTELAEDARMVALTVSDTGCGIPDEVRDRIFEPFFTTKELGQGTGLGLATVYGIVQQSGGRIEFASEAGRGTTFTVLLPEERDLGASSEQPSRAVSDRRSGRVLVVEDDAAVRRLVEAILRGSGFDVTVQSETRAAIELLEASLALASRGAAAPFDVAILDVVMPGMTGPTLAAQLLERQPGLGLLFMSGYPRDELSADRPLPAGSGFLPKPFSADELVARVAEILEARDAVVRG